MMHKHIMMRVCINHIRGARGRATIAPMHICIGADMAIGDTIREIREARELSQRQLAGKAGIGQAVLSRIESGETLNPRAETVRAIAEAVNVPLSAILGRSAPAGGSAATPARVSIPLVRRPAHAGVDWTWEGTGQTVQIDEAESRGRNLLAVTVEGGCMVPDVLPGDLVIFDQWDRSPQDRTMVVLSANNQAHVRWVRLDRPDQPEFVDNSGARLTSPEITLEGVVHQIVRRRPRRPDWHDLNE
jgi:transcriptional regulator with XRE-family HTH domain